MSAASACRLLVASSEKSADLLYATKFFVPDDLIWFELRGKTHAVLSSLEIDRARKQAQVDCLIPEISLTGALSRKLGRRPKQEEIVEAVLRKHGVKKVLIPRDFPAGVAAWLKEKGFSIEVELEEFFPERKEKIPAEISAIQKTQRMAEAGMERAWEVLRQSRPGAKSILFWQGQKLTSEILRGEIDAAIIRLGGLPARTIVAGGVQACDPHETGHGPLKANEAIVLDIFPRDQATGYFGDLTRTVVKGKASAKLKKLYQTVLEAQEMVLNRMKPGVDGKDLHEDVFSSFTKKGYPTKQIKGRWVGFFHGVGHSLGLEIHEAPRFAATKFFPGLIMTVEPGLYYPHIGGVRIEDTVVVTERGIRNLTRIPKFLEL